MTTPQYSLRYSKKAKYLQLRLSGQGLEVVIPARSSYSSSAIEQFIQQKKAWIERHLDKCVQYGSDKHDSSLQLPSHINLRAIDKTWEVSYVSTVNKTLRLLLNPGYQLKLIGNIENQLLCLQLLKKWLKRMAKPILTKQLSMISDEIGLPFKEVTIRNNLTRWGSCSSQKNISLCCKLLLLPAPLMRHVLIHELCHTKFMNHGPSFKKLLERLDPQTKEHSKLLTLAARDIPSWVK